MADRAARTGPGLTNQIWLNLEAQEMLFAQAKLPPRTLRVPLWQMWHHELGMMQDYVTGTTRIFLLKGDAYEPILPADFQAGLEDRAEVVRLLEAAP